MNAPDQAALLAAARGARGVINADRAVVVRSEWDYGADKVVRPEALRLIAVYDETIAALDAAIAKAEAP